MGRNGVAGAYQSSMPLDATSEPSATTALTMRMAAREFSRHSASLQPYEGMPGRAMRWTSVIELW